MNLLKQNWLGLIGLIILCVGIVAPPGSVQNLANVGGIVLLITYAKLTKNAFFFYLELVVLVATFLNIFHVNSTLMTIILVVSAVLSLLVIFRNPLYRTWDIGFGILGVAGLIYGYATLSNYGYALGGIATIIYSLIGYSKGIKSALIFALLNVIYSGLAIYMIISH